MSYTGITRERLEVAWNHDIKRQGGDIGRSIEDWILELL
jgi:hypothetical protein